MKKIILATAITAFSTTAFAADGDVDFGIQYGASNTGALSIEYGLTDDLEIGLKALGTSHEDFDPLNAPSTLAERVDSDTGRMIGVSLIKSQAPEVGDVSFYGGVEGYNVKSDKVGDGSGVLGVAGARYDFSDKIYGTADIGIAPSAFTTGDIHGMKRATTSLNLAVNEQITLSAGYQKIEATNDAMTDASFVDGGFVGMNFTF